MAGLCVILVCVQGNSRGQTMKMCAVVLETTGLIGDKCSLYWDFVNNEFRIFNGANGAQLTFSSSIAGYIQKKNPESKILYFDLTSERINYA
jgi:hypothetical protein